MKHGPQDLAVSKQLKQPSYAHTVQQLMIRRIQEVDCFVDLLLESFLDAKKCQKTDRHLHLADQLCSKPTTRLLYFRCFIDVIDLIFFIVHISFF